LNNSYLHFIRSFTCFQSWLLYKQHENPQGINGWLVEGRIYYDAFVLKNKKTAIYVSTKKKAAA